MEHEKYKQFISGYIHFNSVEWHFFKKHLTLKRYKKGEVILHQGDICKELLFITDGLARGFVIDEKGRDFTWSIFFNDKNAHMSNLFVVDYESFLHGTPSSIQIEALDTTSVLVTPHESVTTLYKSLKKGERFGRLMAEEAYSHLHKIIIERQTKSALERFRDFMQKTPYLLDKVPQYHIATFLGITPQHLSRLKREYR